MLMLSRTSAFARKISYLLAITFGLMVATQQAAVAADQCTTSNSSTANAAISTGASGALIASQMINGILITEGQIGTMADRILLTELQIGAMSNRIVYVTALSQTNSITGIYLFTNPVYLGKQDGQYKYSGTLLQVPTKPFGW